MANTGKYLGLTGGLPSEESAINVSAGAGDASKLVKTDAGGKLDSSLMPSGIGVETRSIVASEAIAAGKPINLFLNASVLNVRNADATAAGKECHGYAQQSIASAASGVINLEEATITGLTGLTIGGNVFLAVGGGFTQVAPSTSGNVAQHLGVALSATELLFRPRQAVTLA